MMNPKISCLIVDDERNSREVLKKLLVPFANILEVSGMASDADDAHAKILKLQPQLVFLDIQMPGGDGFSLLKRLEEISFEVIFVTSFDQYAINAIRFNAADYLIKPIDTDELQQAIDTVYKRIRQNIRHKEVLDTLLYNLDAGIKKISVHAGDKVKLIREDEILTIEGRGRYSEIFLVGGQSYLTPRSLKEFEEYFESYSKLLRISKSTIVNSAEITEYSKGDPFIITLSDRSSYEVSRRKKAEILEKLRN